MDIVTVGLSLVTAVAVLRCLLLHRQLRAVARQLRQRREGDTHTPIHLELVDRALETLVAHVNDVIAQNERAMATVERHEQRYRDFVADLSHDLRTPLTAVRGYQQLLASTQLDDVQRGQLLTARRHADRLAVLVDEFFDYAWLSGEQPASSVHRVPVDLAEEVGECLVGAVAGLQAAGIAVEVRVPGTLIVHTDPEALRRILTNLVRNVIQHGRHELLVEAGQGGTGQQAMAGQVWLRMRNEVLRPEDLDVTQVFERRWSSDPAGTGLGMGIVRALAERMGGSVSADLVEDMFEVVLALPGTPRSLEKVGE